MIASRGWTAPQLADRLERPVDEFLSVIAGHDPIDDDLADDLGRELGPSGAFWRQRQTDFEADLDRVSTAGDIENVTEWLDLLPLHTMFDRQRAAESYDDLYRSCLVYFDVSSPDEWCSRYTVDGSMLKASDTFESKPGALAIWLRAVETRAALRSCRPWSADGLHAAVPTLRKLSKIPQATLYISKAQTILAECGVALEVVRSPEGCTASGSAQFVSTDRAAIGMSLRHGTNDHFWFTLFHEIGHLLLHEPNTAWIDDKLDGDDPREEEANEFAVSVLVPSRFRADLDGVRTTHRDVMRLARQIGIHPGILVGQLQYSGIVPFSHLNNLKRPAKWSNNSFEEIA